MGMRVVWIAFGAATSYIVAAIAGQTLVLVLRSRGADISDEVARNLVSLGALVVSAIGGALGMRHALKIEARRDEAGPTS
jgi:hypothetical protein